MNDNLQYKPRRELKQLCSQFNIRTAGVKHDELVQLLRRKLHPPKSEVPRDWSRSPNLRPRKSLKVRDMQSPAMENGAADKAWRSLAGHGRMLRTLLHENDSEQEASPAPKRKVIQAEPGLPESTPLTKSITIGTRRTEFLRKKSIGVLGRENSYGTEASLKKPKAVGTPKRMVNLSNSAKAPEHLQSTVSVASTSEDLVVDDLQAGQASASSQSEALTDTQGAEADASSTIVEPSEPGSDETRGLSDLVSEFGPETISEVSEADEFHDASSKISRYSSLGSNFSLRTATSGISLHSVASEFSIQSEGSGGCVDNTSQSNPAKVNCGLNLEYLDQYLSSARAAEGEVDELIESPIPYFLERLDALDHGTMDEVQSSNSDVDTGYCGGVGGDEQVSKIHADPYQAAMAQDYVNYTRGTEIGKFVEETAGSSFEDKEETLTEQGNLDAGTLSSAARKGCSEDMPVGSPSTQHAKFEDFLQCEDVFHGVDNDSSENGGISGSEDGNLAAEGVWPHHGYIPEATETSFFGAASEDRGHVESTSKTASTSEGARESGGSDNSAVTNSHIMGDRPVIADETNAGEETSSTVIKLEGSSADDDQDEVDDEECALAPVTVVSGKSVAGAKGEIDERGVEVRRFNDGESAELVSGNAEDTMKELDLSAPELEDIILSGPTSSIADDNLCTDESAFASASKKNKGHDVNTTPVHDSTMCEDVTVEEGVNEDQSGTGNFEGGEASTPVLEKVENSLIKVDVSVPETKEVKNSEAPSSVVEEHRGDEGNVVESALPSLGSAKFWGLDHEEDRTTRTGTYKEDEVAIPLPENVEDALEELDVSATELEHVNPLKPVNSSVEEIRGSTPKEDTSAVCVPKHVGDASEQENVDSTEIGHAGGTETPVCVCHGDEDVEDSNVSREVSIYAKGTCDLDTETGTSGLSFEKLEESLVEPNHPGQDDASVVLEAQNNFADSPATSTSTEVEPGDQQCLDVKLSGVLSSEVMKNERTETGHVTKGTNEIVVKEWDNSEKNLQNGHSAGFTGIGAAADVSTEPLFGEDQKRPQPSKTSSNLQKARFKERSLGLYSTLSANSVSSTAVEAGDLATGDSLDDLVEVEELHDADVENSDQFGEYEVSVVQSGPLAEPDIGGREDFLSSTKSKQEDMGTLAEGVSVESPWQPTSSLEEFVHKSQEKPKAPFVSEWASSTLSALGPVTSLKEISKDQLSEVSGQSFAFPVSVVLWCSQSCSSLFGQSNSRR